jgi:hypothetical protein
VGAQRTAFVAGKQTVELQGDRALGLLTGEPAFELLTQATARSKQQRLDSRYRELERICDLARRATLELAHHQRGALIERQVSQRARKILERW